MPGLQEYIPGMKDGNVTTDSSRFSDGGDLLDANANEILEFDTIASAVNHFRFANAATTANPLLETVGDDTNIGADISSKGTGTVTVWTGTKAREVAEFVNTASAVNQFRFAPSATGNNLVMSAVGDDTNLGIDINPKGTGVVDVGAADDLTVGGIIVPQHIEISTRIQSAALHVDQCFFIANRAYEVTDARHVHQTAETTAGTYNIQITKDVTTDAPGAGTDLLTNNTNAGFDGKAAANTVEVGTLTGTQASLQLAVGNRLSLDMSGAATELVGSVFTVSLKRI